ncbi:hypothetical protein T265_14950, partial [Opisthorchis viverrini]
MVSITPNGTPSLNKKHSDDSDNVKVAVRCRPLNQKELAAGCKSVTMIDELTGSVVLSKMTHSSDEPQKQFTFDFVFDIQSKQADLYNKVARPIVEKVLEGYNGTIFAYGQTGTGKTFTMEGIRSVPELRGIIPNSFAHIFGAIAKADHNTRFLVRVSYLEIYNEEVRDLLGRDQTANLDVKERPDIGVFVKDLSSFVVHSPNEMDKLMSFGNRNRVTAATNMNEHSSRSHAIYTVTLECSQLVQGGKTLLRQGKLHLVDLAGSERQSKTGATGKRLQEANKINLSLTTLGNVISALVDGKSTHIPYRNSKLTRLLQDSLGGNSKTAMIANIAPSDYNYEESLSTLRYANRAKNIRNKAKINEDPKDAMLRQFQKEIEMLRKQLEEGMGASAGVDSGGDSGGDVDDPQRTALRGNKKERPKISKQKMAEIQRMIEADKRRLEEQKDLAVEERNKIQISKNPDFLTTGCYDKFPYLFLQAHLEHKEAELRKAREVQSNLMRRMEALQSRIIVGGENLLEKAEAQEKLLEQSAVELERQQRRAEQLHQKLKEKEEERINIEEKYNSLQSVRFSCRPQLRKKLQESGESYANLVQCICKPGPNWTTCAVNTYAKWRDCWTTFANLDENWPCTLCSSTILSQSHIKAPNTQATAIRMNLFSPIFCNAAGGLVKHILELPRKRGEAASSDETVETQAAKCDKIQGRFRWIKVHQIRKQVSYVSLGLSSRTGRSACPASHSAAASVRPSSVTTLNTSKSVFKPRKPVNLATFNARTLKQTDQQVALARMLDSTYRFRLRTSGDAEAAAAAYTGLCIVLSVQAEVSMLDWIPVDNRLRTVRLATSVREYRGSEVNRSLCPLTSQLTVAVNLPSNFYDALGALLQKAKSPNIVVVAGGMNAQGQLAQQVCLGPKFFPVSINVNTRRTDCPARFHVRRYHDCLRVTSYYLEHNHPRSKFIFDRLPINWRLTNDELKECSTLLKYGAPSSEIRQYVADHFGKVLTIKDVRNYRVKCRPPLLNDMSSIIAKFRECGRVLLVESEGGRYSHLCFSRTQQIALFRRFPDVVNVDATHGTNRLGYKLYTFLVTDGMGIGRPVMYAFVESEHFAPLRKLFSLFKDMMGGQYAVKTFVMDKMTSQMRAAKAVFGCDVMLCYFHARQAIRKHTISNHSRHIFHRMARFDNAAEFRHDLQILRRTDPSFVSYLTAHWLHITRKWAIHAQRGLVHFGNVTNNRLENANGRLESHVHHSDSLEHAVLKVAHHIEWLMREYEMHTNYCCDRREIREGDIYVFGLVSRMTTYAANQTATSTKHGGVRHQTTLFPVVSVASQLILLTGGVNVIDFDITAIAAAMKPARCVEKIFRRVHQ